MHRVTLLPDINFEKAGYGIIGAFNILKQIIIEKDPDSNFAENSRTDIAGLYIEEEKFSEAVELLDQVRSSRLEITKNSLLTIAYFRSGKDNDAIALTKKYLDRLPVSPISEKVIKENLLYYYRKNDEKNFNQYVGLLDKYSGNTTLINYLSGKLYFQNKKYNTAYKFFFRLIDSENEYKPEAIYLLGTINLLKNKNLVMAISYFKRLEDEKNPDNEFALKGKINLAILFNERKETELSKKILFDIINKSENRLFKIQAENLVEHFGYKE